MNGTITEKPLQVVHLINPRNRYQRRMLTNKFMLGLTIF